MNTFTLVNVAHERIPQFCQEAQRDRLVQQAQSSRPRRSWRHLFQLPTMTPTTPCATC